ncbi:DNA-binding GntR family transcriptional regulator [Rhodococcus sp. OAS809]|uniref:GntR family transcriptional regulator n=1 Tax=Rhodococcus sp. OAS809 TaxID=2663874 RepID=UPI00178BE531
MPLPEEKLPGAGPRANALYRHLRQAIISGELLPGERMVEHLIAEQYEVSRTPVREALHRLSVDGLVQGTAAGIVVREITIDELSEIFAVREVLEGLASKLAATARGDVDLSLLRETMTQLEKATRVGDVDGVSHLGKLLHKQIGEAAGNKYLAKQLDDLRGFVNQLQGSTYTEIGMPEVGLEEHARIIEAIVAQDGDLAERLTRNHFQTIAEIRLLRARKSRVLPR